MVDLLPRAGYDPRESLAIFAKLRAIEGRDPGAVATLLSSHPPTRERSENIERAIARQRLPGNLIRDSRRFQDVRHRILSELAVR